MPVLAPKPNLNTSVWGLGEVPDHANPLPLGQIFLCAFSTICHNVFCVIGCNPPTVISPLQNFSPPMGALRLKPDPPPPPTHPGGPKHTVEDKNFLPHVHILKKPKII